MKKLKTYKLAFISTALFIVNLPWIAQAKSLIDDEHQAVINTAYNYFNGLANADHALMSKAFDMKYGHAKILDKDEKTGKEVFRMYTFEEFSTFFKKPNTTWRANILSVDIVDNKMAMVKLNFDTPKDNYIDYLVMYKKQEGWRIISKTFAATKKSPK